MEDLSRHQSIDHITWNQPTLRPLAPFNQSLGNSISHLPKNRPETHLDQNFEHQPHHYSF